LRPGFRKAQDALVDALDALATHVSALFISSGTGRQALAALNAQANSARRIMPGPGPRGFGAVRAKVIVVSASAVARRDVVARSGHLICT